MSLPLRPTQYAGALDLPPQTPLPPTLATLPRRGLPAGLALAAAIGGTLVLSLGVARLAAPVAAVPASAPVVHTADAR